VHVYGSAKVKAASFTCSKSFHGNRFCFSIHFKEWQQNGCKSVIWSGALCGCYREESRLFLALQKLINRISFQSVREQYMAVVEPVKNPDKTLNEDCSVPHLEGTA